jgi:hypothetical protein
MTLDYVRTLCEEETWMLSCQGFQFHSLYTAIHFTGFIVKYDIVSAEFLGGIIVKAKIIESHTASCLSVNSRTGKDGEVPL